ncbi:histidine utilization repressor [Agrobacterium salinitolerans]|uniref:Histidine utilization repressor n=1 Tax=Agrobacterium salinitolerans TaxID=1183413 RepID=A0A9X3KV44_9HYPH|nr:histidine utilization repressor [Agrobacterium salinitolerans]MCZ7940276.1 histidine utilization repressor [Agrobacterium salinitolerans]
MTKASAGQTLHQRILSEIEGRIVSGEWPPGHRLPFEVDLADQYHCSRMTVNKVMGQLVKAGLIERRKKSGSFVRQPQIQSAVLQIHDIGAEVESLGLDYGFKILARKRRSAESTDRERLDVAVGTPLLDVLCIHFAGAREFCVEQRLINLTAVPEAAETDFTEIAPGPWLLGHVPWSTAEHRISAETPSKEIARLLGISDRQACLVVERRTWSNSGAVTHVRFTYPGNAHALVARFSPSSD